ncbi:MAG: M12 family metallo-peptidase [Crocinitomicaceae bacterium]
MKRVTLMSSFMAILLCSMVFGQGSVKVGNYFTDSPTYVPASEAPQYIHTTKSRKILIDLNELKSKLPLAEHRDRQGIGSSVYMYIPDPDGGQRRYRVLQNTTMAEGLKEEFPNIRTFDVIAEDDPNIHGKIDYTLFGFHAMITIPGKGKFFIDPVYHGDDQIHMAYWKADFYTDKNAVCEFEGNSDLMDVDPSVTRQFGDCQLRTYRLALCATGEYTTFQGGTVAAAASAQVTTMNRVNGVYERDMAITMVIVANNNNIIYTNSGSDPFTNGNPSSMITQCQSTCDSQIGSANYDIGHVFGTNSGGLAGLGVVCNNGSKGRGVTGSAAPVGDPFDIDYVAHEMGHQFGCNHTFNNSCSGNRNNSTAVEPGSGSTIMAYAGICPPDVQSNSDDHFHGISLQEMDAHILSTSCPVVTSLSNNPPVITATTTNFYVPANTPFALTCTATDPDGNTLLYCWEQMDNEISTQAPVATATNGPNYRSNSPVTSPTRYFPNLVDLNAGNLTPTWEVTPSVSRSMDFRVTVRDQAAGGGCTDHADIAMNTDATAGPFIVTYPNATGITWNALTTETVTWNVANTTNANVNCQNVDIFLSIDGGQTYPTQLADDVPNTGSYTVTVPNTPSATCRVMVMAQNGTFFDISDNDFEIQGASFDYTLACTSPSQTVCQGVNAQYTIDIGSIGGYSDNVTLSLSGLPGGASSAFTTNPVTPAGSSTLTISGTAGVTPGVYNLTLQANSTSGTKQIALTLTVSAGSLSSVTLTYPTDGQTGVASPINFQWSDAGPGATYDVEIASDPGFASIVSNPTGLATNSYVESGLSAGTMYYWRVTANNSCSTAPASASFSFETSTCNTYASTDVPKTISASGTPTVTSTLVISGATGTIQDLDVVDLIGQHTWISDITITLTSPSNTTVTLFDGVCNNENDWDLNFDDGATPGALPCPPVGGGTYQPVDALSAFNGEDPNGTWTLTVSDGANQDGGSLDSWGLAICLGVCNQASTPTLSATATNVCPNGLSTLSITSGNLNDATDWEWYSGSCGGTTVGTGTSLNVNPTSTTTYYVRGTGGCVGTAATCTPITVNVFTPYNGTVNATFCNGDTYTFPDGSTTTTTASNTTVLTDQNGCDSTINTNATVVSLSFTVSVSGFTLSSNQSSQATYQWIDCNNGNALIAGETNQSYTATANGSYAVIVTSTVDGNCEVTSPCETITGVGIGENEENSISIYPNPSDGKYIVKFTGMNLFSNMEITDDRGRIVYKKELNGEMEINLDLTNEAQGVYIMKVRNDSDLKIVKLIKQ